MLFLAKRVSWEAQIHWGASSSACIDGPCFLSCRVVEADPRIAEIREKVEQFASSFPMPGFEVGKVSDGKVHIAPAIGAKAPYSNGNHADVAESNGIKPTSAAGAVIS